MFMSMVMEREANPGLETPGGTVQRLSRPAKRLRVHRFGRLGLSPALPHGHWPVKPHRKGPLPEAGSHQCSGHKRSFPRAVPRTKENLPIQDGSTLIEYRKPCACLFVVTVPTSPRDLSSWIFLFGAFCSVFRKIIFQNFVELNE